MKWGKNMVRTIIVDDDFLVRSYLKQLVSWEKMGFEIAADVRDGEEALQLIEKQEIDVVITDISMPLMDGIELIRKLRQKEIKIYIVVLSCHDDFEYVKEALKLGANEYILKNSLDEETLYELLKNIQHQLEQNKLQYSEIERKEKLARLGSRSLKFHFFNQLLAGTLKQPERISKAKEAGIEGKFLNSAVIIMSIQEWNLIKEQISVLEAEQYSQLFLSHLIEQLDCFLGKEARFVETIYLGEGIFCCFVDLSLLHRSSLMKQKLTSVAVACYRCCKEEYYLYTIGVSNVCMGEDGIRQAYLQAREILKLGFYEKSNILYFENAKKVKRQLPKAAELLKDKISLYIEGKKFEELEKEFQNVILEFKENYIESKVVIQWWKELDSILNIKRDLIEYQSLINIEQLKKIPEDYKRRFFYYNKIILDGGNTAIKQAIEYIHKHYKEQISLDEVAGEISLNSAYFSSLFKQETGVNFSNYLLECRMECAKGLLKSTNHKIKEVASEAGFNDYHYFSKAFKKMVGISPADYRKQI